MCSLILYGNQEIVGIEIPNRYTVDVSVENYKTDEYDLIFWNHGGAIIGSEFDDLSGDNLTLKEMKEQGEL